MRRGFFYLVVATMLWGGNYICGRILADALPATLLNTIRWAISTLILWGMLTVRRMPFPVFSKWKEFLLLGFFGIFAFSTLTYIGLQSISASMAGMISAGIPVAILLFTPIFLSEKISRRAWLGTALSVVGVIILFGGSQGNSEENTLLGQFIILLAGMAWGIYTVLGKRFGQNNDPLTLTAGAALYGTLLSAISCIGTVSMDQIELDGTALLAVLYVSTLASVVAYLAWNAGVRTVGPGAAAPFINLLPFWTVLFGILLLNERVYLTSLIGGILTITGAILASTKGTAKKLPESQPN